MQTNFYFLTTFYDYIYTFSSFSILFTFSLQRKKSYISEIFDGICLHFLGQNWNVVISRIFPPINKRDFFRQTTYS